MQTVNHKMFGVGEVVKREEAGNSISLTVKFAGGKEMKISIPESFELGVVIAEGELKAEVEAILKKKADEAAERLQAIQTKIAAARVNPAPCRHGRSPVRVTVAKCDIETAFEQYLIEAGYKVETDSGNPSTVFSYINGVKTVLDEEGISWSELKNTIDTVIPTYDAGGRKEHIGAKSNETVINAIKRFSEFAEL